MDLEKTDTNDAESENEDSLSTGSDSDIYPNTEDEVRNKRKEKRVWRMNRERHTSWVKSWTQSRCKYDIGKFNQLLNELAVNDRDNYNKVMKTSIDIFLTGNSDMLNEYPDSPNKNSDTLNKTPKSDAENKTGSPVQHNTDNVI